MAFPYTLAIGSRLGSAPEQPVVEFTSWQLERNLDDGCQITWTMSGDSAAGRIISELASDAWLYLHGVLDQRFRVTSLSQQWDADGRDLVEVTAVCYRRLLGARHVWSPLSFPATSQGLILWGLYEHTQAQAGGDLGVTLGDPGPVVLRDRNYEVGANLLELATNLQQVIGGPVYDITANLELVVTLPSLLPVRAQPVQIGTNAKRIARPSGADLFANAGISTGDELATEPAFAEAADVATDPRGRWERVVGNPSITEQITVQTYADGVVAEGRSPAALWEYDIAPDRFFGDSAFRIGDFVEVAQPRSTVALLGDPTPRVWTQVLTQAVEVTADGGVEVTYVAVEVSAP